MTDANTGEVVATQSFTTGLDGAGLREAIAKLAQAACSSPPYFYKVLHAKTFEHVQASEGDHPLCGTISGSVDFQAEGGWDGTIARVDGEGGTLNGEIYSKVPAVWTNHHLVGCMFDLNAGAFVTCDRMQPDQHPQPDGRAPEGVSVTGNNRELQLFWTLNEPEVGYIAAGDPQCNVNIKGDLEYDDAIQRVPPSTLLQTKPFTLSFSGSRSCPTTIWAVRRRSRRLGRSSCSCSASTRRATRSKARDPRSVLQGPGHACVELLPTRLRALADDDLRDAVR